MMLTVHQTYILEVLREIPYLRRANLLWLLGLKFKTNEWQLERDLRQLKYMGRIVLLGNEGEFIGIPDGPRPNKLIWAMDIMAEVCGESLPGFFSGEPPCTLSFYIQDERGYLDFKLVPVPFGDEQLICTALHSRYAKFICTYLFLPESEKQMERILLDKPAYFVFPNGRGGWKFLKKQN